MVVPIILICVATGMISTFVFHEHRRRKVFVGSIGLVASIAMYASPLVVVVRHFFSNRISIYIYIYILMITYIIYSN